MRREKHDFLPMASTEGTFENESLDLGQSHRSIDLTLLAGHKPVHEPILQTHDKDEMSLLTDPHGDDSNAGLSAVSDLVPDVKPP